MQEGNDEYQDDWGIQTHDVLVTGNENESTIDLDRGDFGNYGPTVRWGSIFETMRKLRVARNCKANRMLRSLEFLPRLKSYAIEKENPANL